MKKWLTPYYLQPHHPIHLTLEFIQKWRIWLMFSLFLLCISYPVLRTIQLQQTWQNIQQESIQVKNELTQQQKLLSHLKTRQINVSDNQLTQINQQLEKLLEKHQMQLATLQWNLAQEKSINLVVNQQFQPLIIFIEALNQFPALSFKTITLTKVEQQRLIQFNADLVVTAQ